MTIYKYLVEITFFFLTLFVLTSLSAAKSQSDDPVYNTGPQSETLRSAIASGDWDIDGDGRADALTDGLLFLRYVFGLTGDPLISGVVANDAQYTIASEIEQELATIYASSGDIDGNGEVDALTDGLLLLRYLFGLDGNILTAGVIGSGATLTDSAGLETYMATLMPQAPYITLNGSTAINHEQATSYVDAGATATDFLDGAVTVTMTGSVDSDTAGVYTLSYSATDSEGNVSRVLTRTVAVADSIAPVITLVGEATLEIEQDSTYTDAGATAVDTVDGPITVVTTGSVDTATAGTYTLTYTATDNGGNTATATRVVTVVSTKVTLNVFSKGEVDPVWEEGINAADSGIDWSSCANDGGVGCPNIAWEIVEDSDRGNVLQIEHSSAGEQAILYFKTAVPTNLSLYAGGKILFDIKTISGNSSYTMKIDCVYPCTSGDKTLGARGYNGWETVSVNVDDLVNQGLILDSIDTGLVIWASQYTNTIFQLDNVRWEDTDGGENPEEPKGGNDGWIIPSYNGYESPESYDGYSLTWSDEFSGSAINTDDWGYDIGGSGWGNNELEFYTNRNAYLTEGKLVIRADKENYGGREYTSSRLKTQSKKNFQYGRIDIRALLPEGQGLWPALWMLGKNITEVSWPASGDSGRENTVNAHAWWSNSDGSNADYGGYKTLAAGETLASSYHVFSLAWTSSSIIWYIDDMQYHIMDITPAGLSAFQAEFFFIFNVAVGGNWPGSPNSSTVFPQRMVVDYVRVFQKN